MLDSIEEDLMKEMTIEVLRQCPSCRDKNKILCKQCSHNYDLCYQAVKSHIPKDNIFIGMKHLNSPDVQEAKGKIQKYINDLDMNRRNGTSILIYGGKSLSGGSDYQQNGTGKTSLGCIVLKRSLSSEQKKYTAYFCNSVELINEFDKEHIQHIIGTTDFLMIDSLGEFRLTESTDKARNVITLVLQIRNRKALPTILTTPLNRDTFLDAYGDEIRSLLYKNALFVDCSGEDYIKTHILPRNNPGEFNS